MRQGCDILVTKSDKKSAKKIEVCLKLAHAHKPACLVKSDSTDGCKNPLQHKEHCKLHSYTLLHATLKFSRISKIWDGNENKPKSKVAHLIFDILQYSIAVQLVCPSVICKRNILGAAWDSSLSFGAATLRIFCICRTHGPSSYLCKTEKTKMLTPWSKHTVISRHTNRCPQAKQSVM